MKQPNPLKAIFDIRRSELPLGLLMFGYFFLVITSFWILKPIKKSLFIQFYDQQGFSLLVWHMTGPQAELIAKVLNMVVAFIAVVVFTWLARRFRRQQLTFIFTGFFLVSYAAYSVIIQPPLYVPTTADEKYKAKAFIDMFVQRFAKALAVGLSLVITLTFQDFSSIRWLSALTITSDLLISPHGLRAIPEQRKPHEHWILRQRLVLRLFPACLLGRILKRYGFMLLRRPNSGQIHTSPRRDIHDGADALALFPGWSGAHHRGISL